MIKAIAILILSAIALSASADDKKTTAKAKPAPPNMIQPLVIPKDAVPNPDGTYSYTDKAGKKWIFSKTPFGISRIQDMGGAPAMAAAPVGQFIKATDNGDTVRFERQSPFGTSKWEKKKSDLTEEERMVLERQTVKPEPKP